MKKEEEEKLMRSWKRRLKDKNLPGVEIRNAINKVFTEWINRSYGGINYTMTQILTGHDCFNSYLERMEKSNSALCNHCTEFIDDMKHTLCDCEAWNYERDEMKATINSNINLDNIIKAICSNREKWQAVNTFAQKVIYSKKEDERREKRRRKLELNTQIT